MKIKKLLPIVALVLCMLVLLTSCGEVEFSEDAVNKSYEKDVLHAQDVLGYNDYKMNSHKDGIILWTRAENDSVVYVAYNLNTMKEIKNIYYTKEHALKLTEKGILTPVKVMEAYSVLEVVELLGEEMVYSYYTASGAAIAESADKSATVVNDCLRIGEKVYRMNADTLEVKTSYTRSDLAGAIPVCTDWSENYYYNIKDKNLTIYDAEYKFITSYKIPSYAVADVYTIAPFSDDHVVVQYMMKLSDAETESDLFKEGKNVIMNGVRYRLITLRIDSKNGKQDYINTDYFISLVVPVKTSKTSSYDLYYEKEKDIVIAQTIENDRIETDENYSHVMMLNSKLKGDRIMCYKDINVLPVHYGNGHVVLKDSVTGRCWVFNAEGDEIGEISTTIFTERYIVTDTAIYTYNLAKATDFKTEERTYTYRATVGNNILVDTPAPTTENPNAKDIYLYNGTFTRIGSDTEMDLRVERDFYGVKNSAGDYDYYDASGNLLFTSYDRPASTDYVVGDGCILVTVYRSETDTQYYRLEQNKNN